VKSADVVIIGGGMVGLSTAYQLALKGVQTRLFQAGDLGGGTSSANAGRAQVSEGPLDALNLHIIRQGLMRFDTLEEELGTQFEWHRLGYLCLINTEELWQVWKKRAQVLTGNGIPTELLDRTALSKAEPNLNTSGYLGAAYSVEGLVNPFLLNWAYSQAARRLGVHLHSHCPVTDFDIRDQGITAVKAGGEWYPAESFVFTSGAWTRHIFGLLGIYFPMFFTHAEAFVTEAIPLTINHTIGLADFYERIHGRQQASSIGVGPHLNGSLLVTEAVTKTKEIHRATTAWGITTLARELLDLLPVLRNVRVVRAWGSPTPFTIDEQPAIGWMPQLQNAFVGAGFLQTITALPLVSEWMAQMICGDTPAYDLGEFSPGRFFEPGESFINRGI